MSRTLTLAWLVALALTPAAARAETFAVNDLGDAPDASPGTGGCATSGGVCTLRAAIMEGNAVAGTDTVTFAVAGTLILASPYLISASTIVDGSTAPGFQDGSPSIAIQATGAVDACVDVTAGSTMIRGLHILGGCTRGIRSGASAGLSVVGNVIGVRPAGSQAQPLATGIEVASPSATIGGLAAADRNIVSGATGAGISITGSRVTVRNNFVGSNPAGDVAVPNGTGVVVGASLVNIGQAAVAGSGNVISGNGGEGIRVLSGSAFVHGNRIGLSADGSAVLGNGGDGVEGLAGSTVTVGGAGVNGGNEIAASGGHGVRTHAGNVESNVFGSNGSRVLSAPNASGSILKSANGTVRSNVFASDPEGVTVLGPTTCVYVLDNEFHGTGLGIDLADDGPTANDADDSDVGPNGLQNAPVISSVTIAGNETNVAGKLTTAPNTGAVEVEILADGVPQTPPLSIDVGQTGAATFEATIPKALADGTKVRALATAVTGSSELGEIVPVGRPVAIVAPPSGAADLAVDLQGPTTGLPGQELTYRLIVTNVGTVTSEGAVVQIEPVLDTLVGRSSLLVDEESPRGAHNWPTALTIPYVVAAPRLDPAASFEKRFTAILGRERGIKKVQDVALVVFQGVLGDRTLEARLQPPRDTADPATGPNRDQLTTTFRFGETGNDSAIKCPARGARPSRAGAACRARARSLKAITGTASGDVARIEVAVLRASGGARAAAARCSWLGAKGRFVHLPAAKKRCTAGIFYAATGTRRWRFRLAKRLPRGSYVVYSRAISKARAPESSFSARDGNRVALKLR